MLNGVLVARWLGKELFGQYAAIVTALTFLASFLGFGMDTWLLREGGREPAKLRQNAAGVVILKLIIASALCGAAFVMRSAWASLTLTFGLAMLGLIADGFSQTAYAVLRARRQNGRVALMQVIAPALALGGLLAGMLTRPAVPAVIAIQSSVSMLIALALGQQVWRFLITRHQPTPEEDEREERAQLRDFSKVIRRLPFIIVSALPFIGADILASLYSQSGAAILGGVDQIALGQYKVAYTVITATYIIPTIVFMVTLPMLSDTKTSASDYAATLRALSMAAAVYGGLAFLALLFASPLITFIYGQDYADAAPLLRQMSAMPLFKTFSFLSVAVMLSLNRQRLRMALQIGVVALSVVGGLMIIPQFGAPGAAGVAVAVELSLCVVYGLGARHALRKKT